LEEEEEEEKADIEVANLRINHSVVDLNKLFVIIYLVFLLLFQEILHDQPMISSNCYYYFHTDDAFYHLKNKNKSKHFYDFIMQKTLKVKCKMYSNVG
jgi:hypothetical protein